MAIIKVTAEEHNERDLLVYSYYSRSSFTSIHIINIIPINFHVLLFWGVTNNSSGKVAVVHEFVISVCYYSSEEKQSFGSFLWMHSSEQWNERANKNVAATIMGFSTDQDAMQCSGDDKEEMPPSPGE